MLATQWAHQFSGKPLWYILSHQLLLHLSLLALAKFIEGRQLTFYFLYLIFLSLSFAQIGFLLSEKDRSQT